jgi:hypothetical protein
MGLDFHRRYQIGGLASRFDLKADLAHSLRFRGYDKPLNYYLLEVIEMTHVSLNCALSNV